MITSRIFGGLGNQLFQYAAGRAVALAGGDRLQLDARMPPRAKHFSYALDHFNVAAGPAMATDLPPGKNQPLRYVFWRGLGLRPKILREKGLGFDASLLERRGDYYLHGYWQSEKYFKAIESRLRDELTIITPPSEENARWLDDISNVPSVSVHVRRSDYLSSANGTGTYATCDEAYYLAALDTLAEKVGKDLVVFVFSDDPAWARENLRFAFETRYAGHNGMDKHYEDMRLIAACHHNIIANSTFSWWGGWLNANPEKQVVAPKKWFNSTEQVNPDIIPEGWITL
ncbi:MAG: alpha-1,2-fucosyltransferase [Pseudomonadota bacterium]